MIDALQLLKDGGVEKVFFIGSIGGKDQEIGTIVIPEEVIDYVGILRIFSKNTTIKQK